MHSSNNPKISQHTRTQIRLQYNSNSKLTQGSLTAQYNVFKQTISKIIHRARNQDFLIHKPTNHRYLTEHYIKKRLVK